MGRMIGFGISDFGFWIGGAGVPSEAAAVERWMREENAPGYRTAVAWLLPRCRTAEERALGPALLLLLAPLNGLVAPCRPVVGSRVNFQVTISRQTAKGVERARVTVRTGEGEVAGLGASALEGGEAGTVLYLQSEAILARPLVCAASVLERLMARGEASPVT